MTDWISVKDKLPKPETAVLVLVEYGSWNDPEKKCYDVIRALYEDGSIMCEDSSVGWDWDIRANWDYVEDKDDYIVTKGWYEDSKYSHAEWNVVPIDDGDIVTHWMPLPAPPEGGGP